MYSPVKPSFKLHGCVNKMLLLMVIVFIDVFTWKLSIIYAFKEKSRITACRKFLDIQSIAVIAKD